MKYGNAIFVGYITKCDMRIFYPEMSLCFCCRVVRHINNQLGGGLASLYFLPDHRAECQLVGYRRTRGQWGIFNGGGEPGGVGGGYQYQLSMLSI